MFDEWVRRDVETVACMNYLIARRVVKCVG